LFRDKIITARFRAWQRFPLLMPELFYPLSLCLSSFPHAGLALSIMISRRWQTEWAGLGANLPGA